MQEAGRHDGDGAGHAHHVEAAVGVPGQRVGGVDADVAAQAGRVQARARGGGKFGMDLQADHLARQVAQAGGQVAAAGADLQHVLAGLRLQRLQGAALDDGIDFLSVSGARLAPVMPTLTATGSVGIVSAIADSITRASIRDFRGLRPGWDLVPTVRRFLERNDLAIMPRFRPERPTLILQGDVDVSVPEPITRAFLHNLGPRAQNIAYRCYPGVDHFQIVREGLPAALEFLHHHFDAQR